MVVRVRNVGKQNVKFQRYNQYFTEIPPTITDGGGKPFVIEKLKTFGLPGLEQGNVELAAGKETQLAELKFNLKPASENGVNERNLPGVLKGTGKFQIHYGQVDYEGDLRKLATGKLELEVKADPPAQGQGKQPVKEGFTAWGKEINGLQAGLGFRLGEKRAYHHGETVTVALRVRNVGKEAVEFKHIVAFFFENPPTMSDADGKLVQLPRGSTEGRQMPGSTKIAPGKEIELFVWQFDLLPKGERSNKSYPVGWQPLLLSSIHGTGKFSLQCERIVGPTTDNPNHPNPTLSKLATGKLELEIKSDPPPADKKPRQKQEEGLTAWGKEVGGLQAGVTLRPGERRAYKLGEVITLAVRVRNVGKETVKFEYVRQFLDENLPTVTNADGKKVEQHRLAMLGFHVPMEVTLEAGKEIELESRLPLRYEFRPANGGGEPTTKERKLLVETGKVIIQYERVFGSSSSGTIKLDPALSKLGTGKLELEVNPDPPKKQGNKQENSTRLEEDWKNKGSVTSKLVTGTLLGCKWRV